MNKPRKPRILIYDIENTSPVGDAWQGYNTNIHHWRRDWWILCFAYKWLGEKKVHVVAQPDFMLDYEQDRTNDYQVVKKLHELMSEADGVIAHNGDHHDQPKARTRMIMQGINPPVPYFEIDTRKVARREFKFTSNKLDDLARFLGIKGKLDTGGYSLWLECEAGNMQAWRKMKSYNKQDVVVLEQVYLKLRPWMRNHPAMNLLTEQFDVCPKCGAQDMQESYSYKINKSTKHRWNQCQSCGGWSRNRSAEKLDQQVSYVN